MENNGNSLLKTSLTWGVILGLAVIIYSLLLFFTGLWLNMGLGLLTFVIFIVGLVWVVKTHRANLGGAITFGQAFSVAFLTIIFSSILTTLYNYLFYTVINPDAISQVIEKSMEMMENFNIPEEAMDAAVEKIKEDTTVAKMVRQGVIGSVIGGAIISLIIAAIMKKKPEGTQF